MIGERNLPFAFLACIRKCCKITYHRKANELKFCIDFLGKCIFDKWGDFGPCQNGVKTKKREVLQGGEKCQRRAVKMRKCKG